MNRVLKGETLAAADVVLTLGVCAVVAWAAVAFVTRTLRSAALK
jgi:sodium transport system permease protein